jgi:hypothetical protein
MTYYDEFEDSFDIMMSLIPDAVYSSFTYINNLGNFWGDASLPIGNVIQLDKIYTFTTKRQLEFQQLSSYALYENKIMSFVETSQDRKITISKNKIVNIDCIIMGDDKRIYLLGRFEDQTVRFDMYDFFNVMYKNEVGDVSYNINLKPAFKDYLV